MKKPPMEKESNISLGGALILLALFAQTIFSRGKKIILSRSFTTVSLFINFYLLHENWSVFLTANEGEEHCLQICVE